MAEKIKGDVKMVTDYSFNEDGKKVKTVRHYKIERKMVPKIVAERRNWHKFGMSKDDKPGPNPQVQYLQSQVFPSYIEVMFARPQWWLRRSGCSSWRTSRSTRRSRTPLLWTLWLRASEGLSSVGSARRTIGPPSALTRTPWAR